MAGKNNRLKKKTVRDTKDTPPPRLTIDPGNVSVLTVKLLDQINQNLVTLIEEIRNGRS
jgi:hypothetical protein